MTLSRPTTTAALIGGAALTIDAIVIAIANSPVGLADSALWLIGLLGLVSAAALCGRDLSVGLTGARRPLAAVALAVVLVVASALVMIALDGLGAHLSTNRGVHDELGTFGVGLVWLFAVAGRRLGSRRSRPVSAGCW